MQTIRTTFASNLKKKEDVSEKNEYTLKLLNQFKEDFKQMEIYEKFAHRLLYGYVLEFILSRNYSMAYEVYRKDSNFKLISLYQYFRIVKKIIKSIIL